MSQPERARLYFELGARQMPLHEHVSCACGSADCSANVRITVLADGRRVEVLAVSDEDGAGHVGIIVDAAGARQVGEIAAELLDFAAKKRPGAGGSRLMDSGPARG